MSGQNPEKPGIKPLYPHPCALGPWASHFSLICTYTSGGFTHNAFQARQGLDKCWLVEGPLAECVDFWDFLEPTLLACEVDLDLWSLLTPLRPNPRERLPPPPGLFCPGSPVPASAAVFSQFFCLCASSTVSLSLVSLHLRLPGTVSQRNQYSKAFLCSPFQRWGEGGRE